MTPPSQPGYATSRDTSTQVEYGYAMIRFDLGDGRYNGLIVKSYYKKGVSICTQVIVANMKMVSGIMRRIINFYQWKMSLYLDIPSSYP